MSLTELQATVAAGFFEIDKTAAVLQETQSTVGEAHTILSSVAESITHSEAHQSIEALAEAHRRIGELSVGLSAAKQSFTEYLEGIGVMLPSLAKSANDSSRNNIVSMDYSEEEPVPLTEQEVLQQLVEVLDGFIEGGSDGDLKAHALSIKDSFNFIGERELTKACAYFGEDWASYLEENEQAQILIVPGASMWQGHAKSDALVVEKILGFIERAHPGLQERIVASLSDIHTSPDKVRVIVVDDWTLSRKQMSATLKRFAKANEGSPYINQIEINLVIALPEMIAEGFIPIKTTYESDIREEDEAYVFPGALPVKSVYVARPRISADNPDNSPVGMHASGSHSTADFGFEETLDLITDELDTPRPSIVDLRWTNEEGENAFPHFRRLYGIKEYNPSLRRFVKRKRGL